MSSTEQLDYHDFHRLQEQSERDRDFIAAHNAHWTHGPQRFYSVISYTAHELALKKLSAAKSSDSYFLPMVSMAEVTTHPPAKTRLLSERSTEMDGPIEPSQYQASFKNDDQALPFSGLLHFPAFSYTVPGRQPPQVLSLYVYQAHFEVGEVTYMFGGFRVDPGAGLKQLGIPRSTDLSRVSVHLACDMPPFVNKEVLMSPAMCQNFTFLSFNPTRSTVFAHDLSTFGDTYPARLCEVRGTQISSHQVLFAGGYEVKVDSVTYREDINRWIVHKSIELNRHGYILDVRRMKFSKVELRSKLDYAFKGLLGAFMVSSQFGITDPKPDIMLPVTATSTSSTGNFAGMGIKNDLSSLMSSKATAKEKTSSVAALLQPSTPVNRNLSTRTAESRTTESTRTTESSRSTISSSSTVSAKSSTRSTDSKSQNLGGATQKVTSMFLKSTKLFHRSNSNSRNENAHHSSQSNYLAQVKQHRTQTRQTSRPTSPQVQTKKSSQLAILLPDTSPETDSSGSTVGFTGTTIASPQPTKASTQPINLGRKMSPPASTSPVESVDSASYRGMLLNESLKAGVLSVCVYIFGGFYLEKDENNVQKFKATNELLKIELIMDDPRRCKFHPEALIFTVVPKPNELWPKPRGYFACIMGDTVRGADICAVNQEPDVYNDSDSGKSFSNISDILSAGGQSTMKSSKNSNGDVFFEDKSLIIQGGVDEDKNVYSDFLVFNFGTGSWLKMLTFAFDYYDLPKKPWEDELTDKLLLETQVEDPALVEAELRCCHHKAMQYTVDGKDYLIFVGGFGNDYLRHFDKVPYESDRFDVTRVAKLLFSSTNTNLLRLPVLNLNTQVWRFSRFFYDLTETITPNAMDVLMKHKFMRNARLCLSGGAFSIVNKQLTLCHGMAEFVPENAEDFGKFQEELGTQTILLGGHFHLIFPGI